MIFNIFNEAIKIPLQRNKDTFYSTQLFLKTAQSEHSDSQTTKNTTLCTTIKITGKEAKVFDNKQPLKECPLSESMSIQHARCK